MMTSLALLEAESYEASTEASERTDSSRSKSQFFFSLDHDLALAWLKNLARAHALEIRFPDHDLALAWPQNLARARASKYAQPRTTTHGGSPFYRGRGYCHGNDP
jgi:hypothetical protein